MTVSHTRPDLRELAEHSVSLIEREQAPSGAYPACSSFAVYGYSWLRDGSFIAEGVSAHGGIDSASAFHDWTAGVITARADRVENVVALLSSGEQVASDLYLPTRYTLDGRDGTDDWWDFQLDGYGTWLWALDRHLRRHPVDESPYRRAAELIVHYLSACWQQPCYDWWEEHPEAVHVATLASIEAGLRAAARSGLLTAELASLAEQTACGVASLIATHGSVDGRLRKWLGSTAVDGSLLAAVAPFEVVEPGVASRTVAAVEKDLVEDGGVHRFRADVFYGGGRWPVLAGLLGESYLRLGRREDARRQLEWIAGTADADGHLPEQVSDLLLAPAHLPEWIERWGTVARPLLWSHAAYLSLAAGLGVTA